MLGSRLLLKGKLDSPPSPPSPPQSLTATQVTIDSFNQAIDLEWLAPATDGGSPITDYNIYRSTSPNPTSFLTSVDGSTLSYSDNFGDGNRGTTFYYRVTAVNSVDESDYSNQASATTTVICTELYRQGLISTEVYRADAEFGRQVSHFTKLGYLLWARPVVRVMKKSAIVTNIVFIIARPWTIEMAYQVGIYQKGSLVGKLLMTFGLPICYTLGYMLSCVQTIWSSGSVHMLRSARLTPRNQGDPSL